MRHVITGGSGFTGQVLAKALSGRGEQIVLFDTAEPRYLPDSARHITGDVTSTADLQALELGPEDVLHHLAARQFHLGVPKSGRDEWFAEVNVDGTAKVLAAMKAGGAHRLVFFSTDMTYGLPQSLPVTPDHPQNPLGPYGRSKKAAEALIRAEVDVGWLQGTIFRPRLISGAGRLGILTKLFELIRRGLPVPMIGSGANRYQMVAVEDCAKAALLAVEKGCPAGPFNLGSDNPPLVRDLLKGVINSAGSKSILLPTPGFAVKTALALLDLAGLTLLYPEQFRIADLDVRLDTSATKEALGWTPTRQDTDILTDAYELFLHHSVS